MKIQEVEQILNISRANIRYYEKEGLLTPNRNENQYRKYSEEDVKILKKVIILRKLGFSIEEIKNILQNNISLKDALETNITKLHSQLDELESVINVCETLQKDTFIENEFDSTFYWDLIQMKETQGSTFMNIVEDYIEFEKQNLEAVWQNVFFFNLKECASSKGWKYGLLIIFIICICRGLAVQFLWKSDTFLTGFLYPMFLFLTISVITFPLYVLNHMYKDEEVTFNNPSWLDKIPFLFKIIILILYVFILMVGIPILVEKVLTNFVFKNQVYLLSSNVFIIFFIMGIYLLFLTVWLNSQYGLFGNAFTNTYGFVCKLPQKIKNKVILVSIVLFLLSIPSFLAWNEVFTLEGVQVQHLLSKKTYTWDDIEYYTLEASHDGYLEYIVGMDDGTKYSCMGGYIMFSNLPEKDFPEADEDYVKYLIQVFKEKEIPAKVEDWEQLYKDLGYDYWTDFAKELKILIE